MEVCPHETEDRLWEAIFARTDLVFGSADGLKFVGVEVTRLKSKSETPYVVTYTLNLKSNTSPSFTTYSLPSIR